MIRFRLTGQMSAPVPATRSLARRLDGAEGGAAMAVGSMLCVQLGLALSVRLFDRLGPLGVVALRLGWAGLVLPVLVRPRPRDFTRRDLLACGVLGAVTAGLSLLFMLALARIPLATASALEFLGPLAVSLYGPGGGHKRWGVLAAIGVVLLTQPWHGGINPAGLALALGAAACWAGYILLTQHVGDNVTGLNGLAVSLPVAGAIAVLAAGPAELGAVTWPLLLIMLALALLHPVLPFTLELLALRRLTATAFGTLMSLEPAVALLAGLLLLGQLPSIAPAFGVILVVIAGIGATRAGARPAAAPRQASPRPDPSPTRPQHDHFQDKNRRAGLAGRLELEPRTHG
jgi:inner membrane transporter RhtA